MSILLKIRNKIPVDDYHYDLPERKIAAFPLPERDKSKLLIYIKDRPIKHDIFQNLANYIDSDKIVIFNNTKVIQARIIFRKQTGASIEILCLNPIEPADYEVAFQSTKSCIWKCVVGNLKKWKTDAIDKEFTYDGIKSRLIAKKEEQNDSSVNIRFSWNNDNLNFADILEINGTTPLPPYIKREAISLDKKRYQTIYSKYNGSIAAPTAGLHISEYVLNELSVKGIKLHELTLHVGAGTFQPVKEKYANDHKMHSEQFIISKNAVTTLINNIDNTIAVGTTTVRTLESIYWLGIKLRNQKIRDEVVRLDQWEAYSLPQDTDVRKSLEDLHNYMKNNSLDQLFAETQIMIVPGYKFRLSAGMITNFHLPKSTLLLLVAAFVGGSWKEIYEYALKNEFRFLSYGDCSLLLNE
ncbi:MAG: S-adenosylmethionine:tRNA ribosyltransferase-isomerase [Bacteroidales bacterium]|nr:MAG: S-adenosylmethionine:tRNA ribosyltransferase-isomerase [Bacteroidales bacterium]